MCGLLREGHAVDQAGDVRGAADLVELPFALEFFLQRDEVDRRFPVGEVQHPCLCVELREWEVLAHAGATVDLRGTAYEFNRNDRLQARNFFDRMVYDPLTLTGTLTDADAALRELAAFVKDTTGSG